MSPPLSGHSGFAPHAQTPYPKSCTRQQQHRQSDHLDATFGNSFHVYSQCSDVSAQANARARKPNPLARAVQLTQWNELRPMMSNVNQFNKQSEPRLAGATFVPRPSIPVRSTIVPTQPPNIRNPARARKGPLPVRPSRHSNLVVASHSPPRRSSLSACVGASGGADVVGSASGNEPSAVLERSAAHHWCASSEPPASPLSSKSLPMPLSSYSWCEGQEDHEISQLSRSHSPLSQMIMQLSQEERAMMSRSRLETAGTQSSSKINRLHDGARATNNHENSRSDRGDDYGLWACSKCTLLNPLSRPACDACEHPQRESKKDGASITHERHHFVRKDSHEDSNLLKSPAICRDPMNATNESLYQDMAENQIRRLTADPVYDTTCLYQAQELCAQSFQPFLHHSRSRRSCSVPDVCSRRDAFNEIVANSADFYLPNNAANDARSRPTTNYGNMTCCALADAQSCCYPLSEQEEQQHLQSFQPKSRPPPTRCCYGHESRPCQYTTSCSQNVMEEGFPTSSLLMVSNFPRELRNSDSDVAVSSLGAGDVGQSRVQPQSICNWDTSLWGEFSPRKVADVEDAASVSRKPGQFAHIRENSNGGEQAETNDSTPRFVETCPYYPEIDLISARACLTKNEFDYFVDSEDRSANDAAVMDQLREYLMAGATSDRRGTTISETTNSTNNSRRSVSSTSTMGTSNTNPKISTSITNPSPPPSSSSTSHSTNTNGNMNPNNSRDDVDNMTYEELLEEFGDGNENKFLGADPYVIFSLPVSIVQNPQQDLPLDKRQCSICLEDFQGGEERKLLPCWHGFHSKCVDRWLFEKGLCPVCKVVVDD